MSWRDSETSKNEYAKALLSFGSTLLYFLFVFIYLASKERTRSMALRLLHESDYNYTKAKFFILFPYYKTYNVLKSH